MVCSVRCWWVCPSTGGDGGDKADGGGTLRYAGKVGTGFSQSAMEGLVAELAPLASASSPFDEDLRREVGADVTWVRPLLVGEVRFSEWTPDGRLRHPVWRGIRSDKRPPEVVYES